MCIQIYFIVALKVEVRNEFQGNVQNKATMCHDNALWKQICCIIIKHAQ